LSSFKSRLHGDARLVNFVINSVSVFSKSAKLASLLLHPLDQIEAEAIINDGQFCKQLCECSFTSAKHTSLLLPGIKSRLNSDARLVNFVINMREYLAKVQNMLAYCSILWTKMRLSQSSTMVNFVNNYASVFSPAQSILAYCCLALKAGCMVIQGLSIL
jgi:hypothetical protein